MALAATIAAILNMAGAVSQLPGWSRLLAIVVNFAFVAAGVASGEILVWGSHLALIPLNAALLIGGRGGRSA